VKIDDFVRFKDKFQGTKSFKPNNKSIEHLPGTYVYVVIRTYPRTGTVTRIISTLVTTSLCSFLCSFLLLSFLTLSGCPINLVTPPLPDSMVLCLRLV
jgi:hypothetical protein